jgi:SnoaL-like domain
VDALERLVAVEQIKQLKARYFRCLDTKDWDGFAEVFASDAEMDMSGETGDAGGIVRGRSEIVAFVRGAIESVQTVHHGHTPEIDVTSARTAIGTWAMEDVLRWPDGGPLRSLHGYGHYHETYERISGQWYIKTITLTRVRVDTEPA